MEDNNLKALSREEKGKGPARQIRIQGRIPGVFYYRNDINVPLSVDAIDFRKLLRQKPVLINLHIEGREPRECVIRDIQRDPVEDNILHIDLMGIKRGQKLTVTVPVATVGTPVGVKTGGGILQLSLSELDIVCLPKDIPAMIEVDVAHLEIGQAVYVGKLDIPGLEFQNDDRDVIASVVPPAKIKEPEVEVEEEEAEEKESETVEKKDKETDTSEEKKDKG